MTKNDKQRQSVNKRHCAKEESFEESGVNNVNGWSLKVAKRIVVATTEPVMLTRVNESIRENVEMQVRIFEIKTR